MDETARTWSETSQGLISGLREQVQEISDTSDAVDTMVKYGQVVQEVTRTLRSHEVFDPRDMPGAPGLVSKMGEIHPDIRRMMGLDIRSMLRNSGGNLSAEERDFWEGLGADESILNDPAEWWNSTVRSKLAALDLPHDFSGAVCWCGARGIHGGQPR